MRKISLEQFNWSVVLLVCLVYIWAILRYTVNMPYMDDYGAILEFLNKYVELNSFSEKLSLIFKQHNEHRIVFNKIIELFQFKLIGEVNFLYLIIIGNIGWFLVLWFLWRYSKEREISIIYFLPVVLLMLSFIHFELMTWAMASLQQYYQILFSILAIYFLVNSRLAISFLFMIISIFTGGGGVVLIPLFILYFIMKKDIKNIFITLIIGILLLLTYFVFLDYSKPGHNISIVETLLKPSIFVQYILVFIGSIGKTKIISLNIGIFSVFAFLFIGKKLYKKEPFLFWSIMFVFATASVVSLTRAGFGIEQALSSRYAIYTVLLISLIYLSYMIVYRNKKIYFIGLLSGIFCFYIWFIQGNAWLKNNYNKLHTEIMNPGIKRGEDLLKKSYDLKVFRSWQGFQLSSTILEDIDKLPIEKSGYSGHLDLVNNRLFDLSNKIVIKDKKLSLSGWFVDIKNNALAKAIIIEIGGVKYLASYFLDRPDVAEALNNKNLLQAGFLSHISLDEILDEAVVKIFVLANDESVLYETNINFTIVVDK